MQIQVSPRKIVKNWTVFLRQTWDLNAWKRKINILIIHTHSSNAVVEQGSIMGDNKSIWGICNRFNSRRIQWETRILCHAIWDCITRNAQQGHYRLYCYIEIMLKLVRAQFSSLLSSQAGGTIFVKNTMTCKELIKKWCVSTCIQVLHDKLHCSINSWCVIILLSKYTCAHWPKLYMPCIIQRSFSILKYKKRLPLPKYRLRH